MKEGKESAYLVEVVPFTKSARQPSLSYFSRERPAPGTLVKVPMRQGETLAAVISAKSARSAKSELRRAAFALRKLAKQNIYEASLSDEFMKAVKETAAYYAVSPGTLLSALLPKAVLEGPENFFKPRSKARRPRTPMPQDIYLLQMEAEERFGQYRALVRQCFARKNSLLFVVPTHLDALQAHALLSQGIREFAYVFTLKEKLSEAKRVWSEALSSSHPVLFITTPAGIAFERPDIDTIVMERENSRAWRTLSRPYIHFRTFIEKLARASSRQLILGDSVLSLETLWREKEEGHGELSLIRWRLPAAPTTLVDASAKADAEGKFEVFSPELKSLITRSLEEKERVFLFGARKGLAPSTVCGDCGFVLPCLNCGAPVVLHRGKERAKNVYLCHACGNRRDSATSCGRCGSWKLVPLGIGVERIAHEAKRLFPGTPVALLDKDRAPDDRRARGILKRWKAEGGILVGTELALLHAERFPYSALVSADSLFSVPDFGIHERIFYLVSRLRELTEKECLVQTRNIGKQVLAWATQGNIIDFYQEEIAEREALLYPPFSVFVKIQDLRFTIDDLRTMKDDFAQWHPDIYKDSLIIRVPRGEWPNQALAEKLSLLGPQFSIKVDPESIL